MVTAAQAAEHALSTQAQLGILTATLLVTGAVAYHAARDVRSAAVATLIGAACVAVSVGVTLWLSGWLP